MVETGKKVIYGLWLTCIAFIGLYYILHPEMFTSEFLINFIQSFKTEIFATYILLTFLRGFFLIPSTPFVIGGGLLFPEKLILILAISMAGVMFSGTCLYYFSDLLGFSKFLNKKYPSQLDRLKNLLNRPKSTFIVIAWSFFPLIPTDLICYAGGIVKMPFKYIISGVFIGELMLDIIYVYFGSSLSSIFG